MGRNFLAFFSPHPISWNWLSLGTLILTCQQEHTCLLLLDGAWEPNALNKCDLHFKMLLHILK